MNRRPHALRNRARTVATRIVLIGAAALLGACSPDAGRDASVGNPSASTALSISEFQLGTRLGSHGGIAQGTEKSVFSPGETVHVSMRLRGAPQGITVQVVWKAPNGEKLGEETKTLRPGQDYMNFSADGGNLPEGRGYHAEISMNGKPVKILSFDFRAGG